MGEIKSDSDVIAASVADPSAFGAIFERHYDAVHAYLQRRFDRGRADEIASQTFLVAFDGRSRFDRSRPDSRPWLFGIATNLARNHRRHELVELRAIAAISPAGRDPGRIHLRPRDLGAARPARTQRRRVGHARGRLSAGRDRRHCSRTSARAGRTGRDDRPAVTARSRVQGSPWPKRKGAPMSATTVIGIAIVAVVGFWLLGGVLMRIGGTMLVLAGGAGLALTGNGSAVLLLLAGAALWLAGRAHHAVRHRA